MINKLQNGWIKKENVQLWFLSLRVFVIAVIYLIRHTQINRNSNKNDATFFYWNAEKVDRNCRIGNGTFSLLYGGLQYQKR